MIRIFALVLLALTLPSFAHLTLKSRLSSAHSGDYIVTEQGGTYSLILIRSISHSYLVLEEITVQPSNIDIKKISWNTWVKNGAPGAISWSSMVFDLETNVLSQCYSHLEKQWFFIEESDYYLKKLLEMPLRPTRESERKRIGLSPNPGEIDRRRLWKPQLIRNGKKVKTAEFEVVRTKWPADKTKLAGCIFELYLDAENRSFPFPFWMEVQHPHYTFKIRAIDSGSGLQSPMPLLEVINKTSTPQNP